MNTISAQFPRYLPACKNFFQILKESINEVPSSFPSEIPPVKEPTVPKPQPPVQEPPPDPPLQVKSDFLNGRNQNGYMHCLQ